MSVTRFQVHTRRPFEDGRPFGDAGPYERIDGVLHFAVDPGHAANAGIVDLDLAPRDGAGKVHFAADIRLLRPLNAPANGKLYTSVVNRGRSGIVPFSFPPKGFVPKFDDTLVPGDGFLLERGYTVALCAWQWDVVRRPGALGLQAPLAFEADGTPAQTTVRVRFQPLSDRPSEHLAHWPAHPTYSEDQHHQPYPAADLAQPDAVLTVKDTPNGEATTLPRERWRFVRVEDGVETANAEWVTLEGGFEAGRIYELAYRTAECPVAGLGLLAIRDSAAFLRYGSEAEGNPCAGTIAHAFTHGVSQTGRFLREFIATGCNVDESGRQVFDGIFVQIAGARRGDFNGRGAQPSSQYGTGNAAAPPHTYAPTSDCSATLFDEQRRRGSVPKVFEVNTANEYWRSDAALVHTDPATGKDLELPPEVRVYNLAGCQHGPGVPFLTDRAPLSPEQRACNHLSILNYTPLTRAAMANLEAWVVDDVEPPESAVPSYASGTLTERGPVLDCIASIPGAATPDRALIRDSLVAKVDSDGNEVTGIRLPELQAPLGTAAGWNVRHPDTGGQGQISDLVGSTIAFAKTAEDRQATGDPRPSISERYADAAAYQAKVREAAESLVTRRHLLAADVERVVANAGVLYERVTG